MNKQHIQLSPTDREYLEALISKGELKAKTYRRALSLLELDRGQTYTAVSQTVKMTIGTVSTLAEQYREKGLRALSDRPRSGRPVKIDGEQRAKITALACSTPPEGHAKWSLRLLADKVVELDFCEQISHTHVRTILKKTSSSHT
ncbi:MAG: helix-turn-helix domain containing protein [Chloroflexi bacterium]|nr:helix-turn-helix domain containing protein [Chloroflexota bacterium]